MVLLVQLLSVALLGVFCGATVAEGFLMVPWWRSIPASEFHAWYAQNDRRLLSFFRPLTIAALVFALASAGLSFAGGEPRRGAIAAALAMLVMVAMFPVYFEGANAKFSAASLSDAELAQELSRWDTWHRWRMLLSAVAFGAALLSLRPV